MRAIIILFIVISCQFVFSQEYPKSVVVENDTCMIFTIQQSKQMIHWVTERDECFEERDLLLQETITKDSLIKVQKMQISRYSDIDSLYQNVLKENNRLKDICEQEKQIIDLQRKREKRRKVFAIIGGICTTSAMTYLYITK